MSVAIATDCGRPPTPRRRARVLVVGADAQVQTRLRNLFRRKGYQATIAPTAAWARQSLDRAAFDAVIVAGQADLDPTATCRFVRAATDAPIVCTLGARTPAARIAALKAGADDALSHPWSFSELLERTSALLRRVDLDRRRSRVLRHGDLEIDLERQDVRVEGAIVHLTPLEFRLLAFLARQPGRPFTRREILEHLWQSRYIPDERVCDVYISNLRRKIERVPTRPERVTTVRGIGYVLTGDAGSSLGAPEDAHREAG